MAQMLLLLLACVAFATGLLLFSRSRDRRASEEKRDKRRQRRETLERALTGATSGRALVRTAADGLGRYAIGVDEGGQLHLLEATGSSGGRLTTLPPSHVVGAEVVETTWCVTVKGETEVRTGAVDLKVFLADLDRPAILLSLLDGETEWDGKAHRAAREEALAWEGTLRLLARGEVPTRAAPKLATPAPEPERSLGAAERERARELAQRYLSATGRSVDEMSARQVRARDPEAVR